MKALRFDPFLPIIGVVGLIVIWYLAVWYQVVDPVLLPSPVDTFRALWNGMAGGRLGFDFMRTLERTILAILIAAAIAIPLGIALGASERVYRSSSSSISSAPLRPQPCSRCSWCCSGLATRRRFRSPHSARRSSFCSMWRTAS
jgi:ABC-type nitrate/sulfonate/bicarbonate transport system permease component